MRCGVCETHVGRAAMPINLFDVMTVLATRR